MLSRFVVSLVVLTPCLAAGALAHDHGNAPPSPEEAQALCVTEVTAATESAGQDPGHAGAICECLVPKIGEDPALIAEIEANGGLPLPGDASAELDAVVQSCLPTE